MYTYAYTHKYRIASVGLLYLNLLIFTSVVFFVRLPTSFKLVFKNKKQNTLFSDCSLLSCQQYIHSLSIPVAQTVNIYTYLTCDIQLTVYSVSIAITTIMSVTEFKIVKQRFQHFSTIQIFPIY
jgi:hypothetical protein